MIPLPEDVALKLLRGMGAYLRAMPPNELPVSVRRFKGFRQAALAKHRETILAVLDDDTERALIAQWIEEDEPPLRKDELELLRIAVDRPEGWEDKLAESSSQEVTTESPGADDDRLGSSLERQREKARKAKEELRKVKGDLEATLRSEKARAEGLTAKVAELQAEIESLRDQVVRAEEAVAAEKERVDREVRRARADVERAEKKADEAGQRAKVLQRDLDAATARIAELEAKPSKNAKKKTGPARAPVGPRKPLSVPKGRLEDDPETLTEWLGTDGVILLIDGYNVTKAEGGFGDIPLERQRDRLVQETNKLATRFRVEMTIVFDGSEVPPGTTRSLRGPVRVVYSRAGEIADDFIVELLQELPDVPVILATNDRELQDRARAHAATIVTSNQLLKLLR